MNCRVHCIIVASKARVAPLKTITTPLLELNAARVAVSMDRLLRQELDLSFVHSWRYVDTKNNPADLASHGVRIDEFLKRKDWVSGPPFLGESEDYWPALPADMVSNKLDVDDAEVKGNTVALFTAAKEPGGIDLLFERFSN
ncbi:uncharacterized protein LOC119585555 [Penaeus monodon]|uniref:uncharacterized protein LOC119585555 n=1 Tax=Penaeus monodon TaxID=6687 RepID=UPI0018A6E07C|nr:uncharacterized protein LOC119585555 [Penaeus monodon]